MTSSSSGKLILAGNSLGHPNDIPLRSLEWLRSADLVVFEEPRGARRALKAAGIHREFLKYSEHREADTLASIEAAFRAGKTVLYMSDQGMPTVADPGHMLVRLAQRTETRVQVIPGPSSITAALAACPFYQGPFFYQGFLDRVADARRKQLQDANQRAEPTVILETPYRRQALMLGCKDVLAPDRQTFLALDISGDKEQYLTARAADLPTCSAKVEEKLNFVLIIAGK